MASRLMSRSLVSSARSAFQSGGNSFRAARGHSASSTTRPPSSSNRNPLRNDSSNFRRRCAMTMIPLHDAVAGATLISHLAVNSRSRSALSLERCCRWIWEFCSGSNRGVVFERKERSRSEDNTNRLSFAISLEDAKLWALRSARERIHDPSQLRRSRLCKYHKSAKCEAPYPRWNRPHDLQGGESAQGKGSGLMEMMLL